MAQAGSISGGTDAPDSERLPPRTILALKRRGFVSRDGLPLQKALLVIA